MFSIFTRAEKCTKTQYNTKMDIKPKNSVRLLFLPSCIAGVAAGWTLGWYCLFVGVLIGICSVHWLTIRSSTVVVLLFGVGCWASLRQAETIHVNIPLETQVEFIGYVQIESSSSKGWIVSLDGCVYSEMIGSDGMQLQTDAFIRSSEFDTRWDGAKIHATLRVSFSNTSTPACRVQIRDVFCVQTQLSWRRQAKLTILEKTQQFFAPAWQSLAYAVTTAERYLLNEKEVLMFRETGTVHILAVSGLHTGIICLSLMLVCTPLGRWKHLCVVIAMLTFAFFVDSPSCWRATVMFCLWLVAKQSGRLTAPLATFNTAIVLLIAFDPRCIGQIGFHLSVLAVWSLLAIMPRIQRICGSYPWYIRVSVQGLMLSWAASAMVGLYLSFIGVPQNVFSIPINTLVVPLFSCGILCTYIGLGSPVDAITELFVSAADAAYSLATWLTNTMWSTQHVFYDSHAVILAFVSCAVLIPLIFVRSMKELATAIGFHSIVLALTYGLCVQQRDVEPGSSSLKHGNTVIFNRSCQLLIVIDSLPHYERCRHGVRAFNQERSATPLQQRDSLTALITNSGFAGLRSIQHLKDSSVVCITGDEAQWPIWLLLDSIRSIDRHVNVIRQSHYQRQSTSELVRNGAQLHGSTVMKETKQR